VAWSGAGSGDTVGVFARRFSSTGAPVGAEFRVNTSTTGSQGSVRLAFDSTGNHVIAWSNPSGGTGSLVGLFTQMYAAGGTPIGGELRVDSFASNLGVASLHDEDFLVVWGTGGASSDIMGRRVGSPGLFGPAFRVNTYTTGSQDTPAVAHLAVTGADGFVVAWRDTAEQGAFGGSQYGILAQRFCLTRGDASGDGSVDVSDVFYLINKLFAAGPDPVGNADADASGAVDINDVFYLINYLFAGGPPPKCL
jgi:dockerin type I repeat protein